MPRHQKGSSKDIRQPQEDDYLEVDHPVPGQNFVCLSFVSPEKILKQKELFLAYHYHNFQMKYIQSLLKEKMESLLTDAGESDNVPLEKIVALRKELMAAFDKDCGDIKQYDSNFEDFKYREEEKLQAIFDKEHNFQTNVRGLKIRGVYDSKGEADARAAQLQRQDNRFDVFVGQVGYWLPWDPTSTKIANQEYLNSDLNRLVKEYKSNEVKKDMFYNEQKQSRSKDALSTAERLRHKLAMKKAGEENNGEQKSIGEVENVEHKLGLSDISEVSDVSNIPSLGMNNITEVSSSNQNINDMSGEIGIAMAEGMDPWMQHKERQLANE